MGAEQLSIQDGDTLKVRVEGDQAWLERDGERVSVEQLEDEMLKRQSTATGPYEDRNAHIPWEDVAGQLVTALPRLMSKLDNNNTDGLPKLMNSIQIEGKKQIGQTENMDEKKRWIMAKALHDCGYYREEWD